MEKNVLIEFKNVSVKYKIGERFETILEDVNFKIRRNNFTIIFGPSGSGKTTVLNILLGFLQPTTGTVLVDGIDLYSLSQNERTKFRAANFGIVYQTNNWINSLSVVENVGLPLLLSGASKDKAMKLAQESLDRTEMGKYAKYRPSVLSTGQQQRVSMARATVESPIFLVADEPTGNLDSKNGDAILRLITNYKNHDGATVILVTHNLDYLSLSDHRLNIKDGVLNEDEGVYYQNLRGSSNPKLNNLLKNKTVEGVVKNDKR